MFCAMVKLTISYSVGVDKKLINEFINKQQ